MGTHGAGLKNVANGRDSNLDSAAVCRLVDTYTAHARFEEQTFLPLSQTILGRNNNHMAALGMSLHMRHVSRPSWRRRPTGDSAAAAS